MRQEIEVTGIVLYVSLIGEYDKRLVILTKECGKITVFANGARKPGSAFRAASQSFVMGTFTVTPTRDAYNLVKVDVKEYFHDIAYDMEKMCYAAYFSEFMSYYTREGDFCTDNLNLLYMTFKALLDNRVSNELIRYIYELRLMDIEGQGLQAYSCVKCGEKEGIRYFDAKAGGVLCEKCAMELKVTNKISDSLIYTLQYIVSTPVNKLYGFTLSEDVMAELVFVAERFRNEYVDKKFKSLETLSTLG